MIKKSIKLSIAIFLSTMLIFSSLPVSIFATSKTDEFIEVYTIEELYNVRNDLTANYILMNDIDLTDATAEGGEWDFMGNGWNPIGSNDVYGAEKFGGVFDGNGHTIRGMRIEVSTLPSGTTKNSMCLGLFANVSGEIRNLNVINSIYCPSPDNYTDWFGGYIGSIAGKLSGKIYNCSCVTDMEIYPYYTQYIGGIAGYAVNSEILQCKTSGTISGKINGINSYSMYISGICGFIDENVKIENCFNKSQITGTSVKSSSTVAINYVTGICYHYCYGNESSSIINCYNSGALNSQKGYTYGISKSGTIKNCYNSGTINEGIGRAVAANSVSNCYYLYGTGSDCVGATPLTESQMKKQSLFAGFDFDNVWILEPYADYPYPQLKGNVQDLNESVDMVSIVSLPLKTEYMVGDKLDFTGSMLRVKYISGKEEIINITDELVTGFDNNKLGKQTVTVTFAGFSDNYEVTVKERPAVESIKIISQPDIKVFAVGTVFDFTGAKARIDYADGTNEIVDITSGMTNGGNINHIGKQIITFMFGNKSADFEIEVIGIKVDKIVLTSLPNKTNYIEGQSLDLSGMVITAVMNNGLENTISNGYSVSGYSSKPGKHTVTVSYFQKNATFEVEVAEKRLVSVVLNSLPYKLEYISGQKFDDSGMQIIATYDNGEVTVAEDYKISGFDDTPGIKNIVITIGEKQVSFPIKVVAKVITEFKLASLPSKLDYIESESFDKTGLRAEATYNDGSTEEVADYELTGFSSVPGKHNIAVSYKGFVKVFWINVVSKKLEDIKITVPNKTVYNIGETFDKTGLIVKACYNNGQEFLVDDYQLSGFDSFVPGLKTVKITYCGIEKSFVVIVEERSAIITDGNITVNCCVGRLGEYITVPVSINKNTGIAGFKHTIKYNKDDLKIVSVEAVGNYKDGNIILNDENSANGEATILWFGDKDINTDGIVYNITFKILETAIDGNSEIIIDFNENDIGNVSGENIAFDKINGFINIRSYWIGDINGDRKIAMVDLLQLAQYVSGKKMVLTDKQKLSADVNEDGIIDIHDVILLQQLLVSMPI